MYEERYQNHTSALQKAIGKLEEFSREGSQDLASSPLKKAIFSFRSLVADKRQAQIHRSIQGEMLKAIEVVNRERLFIQKLKMGTPAEQKLADSFTKAIDAYNDSRDRYFCDQSPITGGLVKLFFNRGRRRLFHQLPKIDIPREAVEEYHFPGPPINMTVSLFESDTALPICLTKQMIELFQMKALALLERNGIASNPEARAVVKSTPIYVNADGNALHCSLAQKLSLFPGQVIVIKGTSEMDPQTRTIIRLFPESFSVSLESRQTGFPHPLQRTGWALANELLLASPQRPDLLGHLASFFERKKKAAVDLHLRGNLFGQAKKLIKLKKQSFNSNRQEFLVLHKELACELAQGATEASGDALGIVDDYFSDLEQVLTPIDHLADTYHRICNVYIVQPYQLFLKNCFGEHMNNEGGVGYVYSALDHHFENALSMARTEALSGSQEDGPDAQKRMKYIDCMGMIIGKAAKCIILQYLSEDLFFKPPELGLFERKIQAAAYCHAEDFLAELNIGMGTNDAIVLEGITSLLRRQLTWDIELFRNEANLTIPVRLADYFEKRRTSAVGYS